MFGLFVEVLAVGGFIGLFFVNTHLAVPFVLGGVMGGAGLLPIVIGSIDWVRAIWRESL